MSRRANDITIVRRAVQTANSRGEFRMNLFWETFNTIPELQPLVTPEQLAAFAAMDPRLEHHTRRVNVEVAAVEAVLPTS